MLVPPFGIDYDNTSSLPSDLTKTFSKINFSEIARGSRHSTSPVYLPKNLNSCTHVWLRVDRVKKSLEAPYQGPFLVISRTDKIFVLKIKDKNVSVSIDRVKPVIFDKEPVAQSNDSVPDNSIVDNSVVNDPSVDIPEPVAEPVDIPEPVAEPVDIPCLLYTSPSPRDRG